MAVTITMPQLGETVTEGTILSWIKQIGERVEEDEILVEISTDKVDTEVPSPASGILSEILVGAGETVSVGTALAVLTEEGEGPMTDDRGPMTETEPTAAASTAAEPTTEPRTVVEPADTARRSVLSPVVRKLAADNDVDVAMVRGTGDGGRITRKDIEAFIAARGADPAVAETPPTPTAAPAPVAAAAPPPEPPVTEPPVVEPPVPVKPATPSVPETGAVEVREISRLRARIAKNMVAAKQTAAHVFTSVEVDYERVAQIRMAHKDSFKESEGFSLTYLPFIVRATVDALAAFPVVNSLFDLDAGTHTFNRSVHMGIAVDLDQKGLLVATVRDADTMTLKGAARAIRATATKVRSNQLTPDDVAGSTFSITNPGPFGSYLSVPVINVPNSAILSTETIVKRPVVIEMPDGSDGIAIHHIGYLGLSWDHRVFDGSTAALFLGRIKHNLQTWDWEQELS
ncbi:MAG: 2-oxo acid dehydrogenase subunit E2 [Acidimicrobiia bacterium]|nr:2-oxo acid dehydrogenase subunit E2 [Acidimicrobiia bacterium]